MRDGGRPPRPAQWLLGILVPPGRRDEVLGDLEETLRGRRRGLGTVAWYWGQVLLVGSAMLGERLRRGVTRGGEARMGEWVRETTRDAGIALRGLARRPAWTVLALATLVLGAGAVTTGFGLLHRVVLRPLPFQEPDRLVAVRTLYGGDVVGVTGPELLEIAASARTLRSVAALVEPNLDTEWTWSAGGERRPLDAVRVSDGFFRTLGVAPALGALGAEGDAEGRRAVVSRAFWQRELGGDPAAVGRALHINGEPYVVGAVLPGSFELPLGPEPNDVWLLFTPEPSEAVPDMPLAYRAIGRLAPGATPDLAAAELTGLVETFRAGVSDVPGRTIVRSLEEDLVGSARRPLRLLTLAGVLVLLVASLNLSMLIAARNVERREELNVRAALGAGRARLLRHLLAEAGVLALVGGGIATGLAALVLARVSGSPTVDLERLAGGGVGPGIVVVGLVAAVVPALLAAALPAVRVASRLGPLGSRGSSIDRGGRRLARSLAALESGVVFGLLVVAGLVIRSLDEVTSVDPGFDTGSAVALTVFLPPEAYDWTRPEASRAFLTGLEERVGALPGVEAVGTISNLPLSPESWSGSLVVEGREELGVEGGVVVDWELASPGYFEAIGIPLVRGRGFDAGDRAGADGVVLVNETLARRVWPDGDPIGARISGGGPLRTVVGVVGDVKQQGLHAETRGFMYLPALQTGAPPRQELVVRVAGDDPAAAVGRIRAALLELEPDLALGPVRPLDTLVAAAAGGFRFRALLLGAFAAMALLLGMAGIYGVTAHGVRTRRRDIGIRMAMGADGERILGAVLGESLLPVAAGLGVGLVAVVLAAPALRGLLFGVEPTDPASLAGVAALLLASGVAAVLPPALRAGRIDPVGMLRGE